MLRTLVSIVAAALPLLACAQPTVQVQSHPGARSQTEPITLLAVAPFRASGDLLRSQARDPEEVDRVLELAAHHIGEELGKRVALIPADDVARSLGGRPAPDARLVPLDVARRAHAEFGADAIVLGNVWRFVERSGAGGGSRIPASVGFEIDLYSAPGAARLWSGTFDETQKPFGENVLTTTQYPGGGMRWLTGEELLRWGAGEIATAVAVPFGGR